MTRNYAYSFAWNASAGIVSARLAAGAAETKDLPPEEIIQRFAAKEAEFAKARENYTYRQSRQDSGAYAERRGRRASTKWCPTSSFPPTGSGRKKWCARPMSTLQLIC